MNAPENPFAGKSRAEIARQQEYLRLALADIEAAEAKAERAKNSALLTVAAATFAWSVQTLLEHGKFGGLTDTMSALKPQSFPRPALMAKDADMTESQVSALKQGAIDALMRVVKG